MPVPAYGVMVDQDGTWPSRTDPFVWETVDSGQDLRSLFDYLVEKGLVKK